jgi:putative MFS transporter
VGSFLAGSLANFSGRKPTLILGQILQVLSSYLLVISTHYWSFLLNLIIAGIGFGITLIIANTLLSEIMPQKYRGKSLLFISFIAIVGKFFAIFSAYFFGLKNWRVPELYLSVIGILLTIVFFLKIPESFRLLLLKGEVN